MRAHTCFEVKDIKLLLKKFSLLELTLVVCCSKKSIGFTSIVSCVCVWSKNNWKKNYEFSSAIVFQTTKQCLQPYKYFININVLK